MTEAELIEYAQRLRQAGAQWLTGPELIMLEKVLKEAAQNVRRNREAS